MNGLFQAAKRKARGYTWLSTAAGDAHDSGQGLSQRLDCPLGEYSPCASDAEVTSDGLHCFRAIVETCPHWSIKTGGGPSSVQTPEFPWVNTMLGNVKKALHGTCHAAREKHLGRYLGALAYRFNRRFELGSMIERLAYVACRTTPLPYRFATMAEVHT